MADLEDEAPSVTVIVPVFNDVARLRLCLQLIAEQTYRRLASVIVVDNRSTEDLRPALPVDDPRFQLIREERKGSYAARNAALPLVDTDVVAFTDADCRPRPDWIANAVDRLRTTDAPEAVGGAIRLVFRGGQEPATGPELYEAAHEFDQRQFVESMGFAATANLVATRGAIELVGPFNADLQSGGDDDWGHRLGERGGRLVFAPDAVVEHPSRSSWGELTAKTVRVAAGMAAHTGSAPPRRHAVSAQRGQDGGRGVGQGLAP